MRFVLSTLLVAGCACPALGVINYLNQITGGQPTQVFPVGGTSACVDDFEINGIVGGGGGVVHISAVQAVIKPIQGTAAPNMFRVNVYLHVPGSNENIRTMPLGDVFTASFAPGAENVLVQPFPVEGESGNFPGAFLVTFTVDIDLPFDHYYLSVQAASTSGQEFGVVGSNNVEEGTPNSVIRVTNQGPGGSLQQLATNAAYRLISPDPPCAADFNHDGNIDPDDLGDYINCYFAIPGCANADFNGDGNVDPDDLGDYINLYFGGC